MEMDGTSRVYVGSKWSYHNPEKTGGVSFTFDEAIVHTPGADLPDTELPRVHYPVPQEAPSIENGGMDVRVGYSADGMLLTDRTSFRSDPASGEWIVSHEIQGDDGSRAWTEPTPVPRTKSWFEVREVASHITGVLPGDIIDVSEVGSDNQFDHLANVLDEKAGRTGPDDGPGLTIFTA